jgi:hypothetical protein
MFDGVRSGIATRMADARTVWTLCRRRAVVLRSLELTGEMLIRGGVTVATPVDDPVIASTIQLDGDILVEVSRRLLAFSPEARNRIAEMHASAVQAKLAMLPDAFRGGRAALAGLLGTVNAGVLATTWGSPVMFGPIALYALGVVARKPLKNGLHRVIAHAVRGRIERITSDIRGVSETEIRKLRAMRLLR